MIPLLSTCQTPCHLPDAGEEAVPCGTFHHVKAASENVCMQCAPNAWLTTLQMRMRSCVCMACVDAPRLHPPPSPCFQTPWPNIRIQNNSGAGLSPASCVSECLMCSFLYSVSPDICMFFYQQLVCFIICLYITLFCFSHFSLLLSLHYLKCSFIKSFNCNRYFKAVRRPQTWRTKMRIRKTSVSVISFFKNSQKAPYHTLCSSLGSFDMCSLILRKHPVNQHW